MKERPILFSAPMVRAIREDRKTQTRRIINPQPFCDTSIGGDYGPVVNGRVVDPDHWLAFNPCRYGLKGDRLWVRETFLQDTNGFIYRADRDFEGNAPILGGWKPSIHMPRSASRILLEITGVRVERLQDISECDAKAEGSYVCDYFGRRLLDQSSNQGCYKWGYRSIWESLNGSGSWDLNPWVWVVEFKTLEIARAAA
mgnify:CR=1 FL=1